MSSQGKLRLAHGTRTDRADELNSAALTASARSGVSVHQSLCFVELHSKAEIVQGARDSLSPLLQHVSVDHGGGDVIVTEQSLDGPDIRASLEEVSGETVPEAVGGDPLGDSCVAHRALDGFVDDARVEMVASEDFAHGIRRQTPCREHILPYPLSEGRRILACEGVRKILHLA